MCVALPLAACPGKKTPGADPAPAPAGAAGATSSTADAPTATPPAKADAATIATPATADTAATTPPAPAGVAPAPGTAPADSPDATAAAAAVAVPEGSPAPAPGGAIVLPPDAIVGNGLIAYDADLKEIRKLSASPASYPRWLPGREGIVFISGKDDSEIRVLDFATGKERVAGTFPKRAEVPCFGADGEEGPLLDLTHRPEDVKLSHDGAALCVDLADSSRDAQMSVTVRVDLATGKSAYLQAWCGDDDEGAGLDDPGCGGVFHGAVASEVGEWKGEAAVNVREDDEGGLKLTDASGKPVTWGETTVEFAEPSPSGRWVALQLYDYEGDYLVTRVVLLDRASGDVFPVLARKGWPKPLTVEALSALETLRKATVSLDTSTGSVVWLGGATERLAVNGGMAPFTESPDEAPAADGDLWVTPGKGIVIAPSDICQ